jgi:hypothetical protein
MDIKPGYEQIASTLPPNTREALDALVDFFRGWRLSPRWYATGAMNIKFRGKIILRFTVCGSRVDVFFTLATPEDLDGVLAALTQEQRRFYFEHLRRCTGCTPKHGGGRQVTLLGQTEHVCAEPEIRITNPSVLQARMLTELAKVRRENILRRAEMQMLTAAR